MSRGKDKYFIIAWLKLAILALLIFCLSSAICSDALIHYTSPTNFKHLPYRSQLSIEHFNQDYGFQQNYTESTKHLNSKKIFQIEPSDAIDIIKYSQPAVDQEINQSPNVKVPSTFTKSRIHYLTTEYSKIPFVQENINVSNVVPKINSSKSVRDSKLLESISERNFQIVKSSSESDYKLRNETIKINMDLNKELVNIRSHDKNNFTDVDTKLIPAPSNAVLSYQIPLEDKVRSINKRKDLLKISTDQVINVSSHYPEVPISTFSSSVTPSSMSTSLPQLSTKTVIMYSTYHDIEILNQTASNESVFTTVLSVHEETNFSSSVPLFHNEIEKLSSGTVAGIVIAVLVSVTLLSSAVIYILYRKYNGKCTSVVEGKFNTDNCGYLDDSLRSSIYLNNHIELPKESSEEMSSLDNDSFLNSLETMTIQNYWADNSKNTKV